MEKLERIVLAICATFVLAAGPGVAKAQVGRPDYRAANPPTAVGNPRHGAQIAAAQCASCHGSDGNSANPNYPKLAGQNPAYLYRQLWAFKKGERPSTVMAATLGSLTDSDLADVSAFYATRTAIPDRLSDPTLAGAGKRIYYGGRPSCAMCHEGGGTPMMGMMGGGAAQNAPLLRGQHAFYTLRQLNEFASGQRKGGIMNQIAAQLNASERRAVAEYIAGMH